MNFSGSREPGGGPGDSGEHGTDFRSDEGTPGFVRSRHRQVPSHDDARRAAQLLAKVRFPASAEISPTTKSKPERR
jgi:hypothetical protein